MDQNQNAAGGDYDGLFKLLILALVLGFIYQRLHALAMHLGRGQCIAAAIIIGFCAALIGCAWLWNYYVGCIADNFVIAEDEGSVHLGTDLDTGREIHLKAHFRTAHTQLIGTTNAGKTASVILPWASRDIELGRGLILIDGKSDQEFLDKLYAKVIKEKREKDFFVFSLSDPSISSTFNPFCQGTPEQITERVFSSFEFTDEYYRSVQFSALRTVITLLMQKGQVPMPGVIRELLRSKATLQNWVSDLPDKNLMRDVLAITEDDDEDFAKKHSGLVTALGHFSQGDTLPLFNTETPEIVLSKILTEKKICYFQLPTMQFPFLGATTGKLLLQSLQSAISELQGRRDGKLDSLFTVYLDDFNDYIYSGFESLLNKSRSANVGVVFAHQSLGDLEKVSPEFKQIVLTNTNVKIVMRSNDPDSAEHFAKIIGTRRAEKATERRKKDVIGSANTGDQSIRETEEYVIHPNVFKSELGRGEGVVVIPHEEGRIVRRVKFRMVPDLPAHLMPRRVHLAVDFGERAAVVADKPMRSKKKPKDKIQAPAGSMSVTAEDEVIPAHPNGELKPA